MSSYTVKSNLKHNGTLYTKGQSVELNEKEAKQLLGDNVVVASGADVEEAPEVTQPAVNTVKREGDEVGGEKTVEPGKVETPQPGDDVEEAPESEDEDKKDEKTEDTTGDDL